MAPKLVTQRVQNAIKTDVIVKLSKDDVKAAKDRTALKRKHKEVALEKHKNAKAEHHKVEEQVQIHTFAI